jgi:hypothetical protein
MLSGYRSTSASRLRVRRLQGHSPSTRDAFPRKRVEDGSNGGEDGSKLGLGVLFIVDLKTLMLYLVMKMVWVLDCVLLEEDVKM